MVMIIFLLRVITSFSYVYREISDFPTTKNCIIWTKQQSLRNIDGFGKIKIAYISNDQLEIQFLIDQQQFKHIFLYKEELYEYDFSNLIYEDQWILNFLGCNFEKNLIFFSSLSSNGFISSQQILINSIKLFVLETINQSLQIFLEFISENYHIGNYQQLESIVQRNYCLEKYMNIKILNNSQLILEDSYSISLWYHNTFKQQDLYSLIRLNQQNREDIQIEIVINKNIEFSINTYNISKNNQIDKVDYKFTLLQEIQNKWIFFTLNYLKKQMSLKIYPYKSNIIFDNLYQYSYVNMVSSVENDVKLITINNCIQQVQERQECQGCLHCSGPYEEQCQLCNDKQYYHNIDKTCYCKFGFIQQGDQCLELNQIFDYTVGKDTDYKFQECPIGYFLYYEECAQCPNDNQRGKIICGDCYLNPKQFEKNKLKCTFDLVKTDDNYDYQIIERHPNKFQLYFNSIIQLDVAFTQCVIESQCFVHQVNRVYFNVQCKLSNNLCQSDYVNIDDKCIKCTDNCRICSSYVGKCLECEENYFVYQNRCYENQQNCLFINKGTQCKKCKKGYFINEYSKCEKCPIDCQYCQYQNIQGQSLIICLDNRQNNNYISISFQEIKNCDIYLNLMMNEIYEYLNLTLPVSICGKCQQGYINGFTECIQSQNQTKIIKYNEIEFELITLQDNTEIQFCNSYFYIQNDIQYCLECQDGYYQDRFYGNCLKCINCVKCVQLYDQLSPDIIQLYYQYFNLPVINLINQKHLYTECIECSLDKELHNGLCIVKCPIYCKRCQIIDNVNVCIECIKDEHESFIIFNNQCYKCELGCEICLLLSNQEINLYNIYYQKTENSQTKCIRFKNDTAINISQFLEFDIYVYCDYNQYLQQRKLDASALFINDLFSDNDQANLGKIESLEMLEYFNLIRVKSLQFNLIIIPEENGNCQINKTKFVPQLQHKIYTLEMVSFYIFPSQYCNLTIYDNLEFYNITYLQLSGFNININTNVVKIAGVVNLVIWYVTFYQLSPDNTFMFYIQNCSSIKFENIIMKYIQLSNTFIRVVNQSILIDIQYLEIENCFFKNFNFLQYERSKYCYFHDSKINAYFENSSLMIQDKLNDLDIQNFHIHKVEFIFVSINSIILNLNQKGSYAKIDLVLVNSSDLQNSSFLKTQNLEAYNFFCMFNKLNKSEILHVFKQNSFITQQKSQWFFTKVILRSNQLDIQSQLIYILNQEYFDELIFDNLYIEFNTIVGIKIENAYLIQIINIRTLIKNGAFRRTGGSTEIKFMKSVTIDIFNITVYQYSQCQGSDCYNSVLKIQSSPFITISQCYFYNLNLSQPLIEIFGKVESQINYQQYFIKFYNIKFENIFILNKGKQATLITVKNSLNYLIIFDKILIKNIGFINQQNQVNGLIYVNSELSTVQIKDVECLFNFISNSSLFYLYVNKVEIYNSYFQHLNQNYQFIKNFIKNQFVYFEQISNLIHAKGGYMYIEAVDIKLYKAYFYDAIASQGTALHINNFNTLIIQNSYFSNLYTKFNDFDYNLGGAIYLESKYQTKIVINMTLFSECQSLQGGAIYMKLIDKAYILLNLLILMDNYAVSGSFVKTNIQGQEIKIILNESYVNYQSNYNFYNKLSLDYYQNKENQNQIFNIDNCNLLVYQVIYDGYIGVGVLYGQNLAIHIFKLIIMSIENQISSIFYVENLYNAKISNLIIYNISSWNQIQECSLYYSILPQIYFEFSTEANNPTNMLSFYNQFYYDNIFKCNSNILRGNLIKFPLIYLRGRQNTIYIRNLLIQSVNCSFCTSQIIRFSGIHIIIQQLNMFQNICGLNGCFYLKQQDLTKSILKQEENKFYFYDSLIYENIINGGDLIFVETPKILFQNIILYKNNNNNIGSIIHIKQSQTTVFKQLKLSDNIQSKGAQFQFEQSMIPSLIQTQVQCKQQRYMISQATGFTISYRNQLLLRILIKQIETIQYYELLVKDYTLPQGHKTYNNTIYLPCGQKLKLYQYFNNDRNLINLNLTFNIQFLNILNELTQQENQIFCYIQIGNQSTYHLNYTNSFYFDDFVVYDDPYKNQTIEAQINCSPLTQTLYMNIRTFKCQIGEQFINKSCTPCDNQKQFYNILPGQKCKLANSDCIKDVLNNQLILQQGYWRPNYDDKIEFCVNNPQNCHGGIEIGDKSCQRGYIGVLCELCDINNVQGFESHGYNGNFNCAQCNLNKQFVNIITILSISIWIILIYKYLIESIQDNMYWVNRLQILNRKGIKTQKQLKQTYLFQLLLQQIFAYNIYQMTNIYQYNWFNIIALLGNPFYTIERHLDCFHQYMPFLNEALNKIIIKISSPLIFAAILTIAIRKQLKLLVLKLFIYCQYVNILMIFINTLQTKQATGLDFVAFASIQYDQFIPYMYFIIYPIILIFVIIPIVLYQNQKVIKNRQEWRFIFIDYKEQYHYWEFINLLKQFVTLIVFMSGLSRNFIYFCGLAIYLIYRKVFQYYQPIKHILQRKITDTILYNQAIIIIILLILNQSSLVFLQYTLFWFYIQNLSLILHHLLDEQSIIYKQRIIKSTIEKYIPKFNRGKQSQIKLVNIIRGKIFPLNGRLVSNKRTISNQVEFELVTYKTRSN